MPIGRLIIFRDDKGKFRNGFVEINSVQFAIDNIREILEESVKTDAPNEVFFKIVDKHEMLVEFKENSKFLSDVEARKVFNTVTGTMSNLFDNVEKFVKTENYNSEAVIPLLNQSRDMNINGLKELATSYIQLRCKSYLDAVLILLERETFCIKDLISSVHTQIGRTGAVIVSTYMNGFQEYQKNVPKA